MQTKRVLLDTNVWNYLADHADAVALAAAARKGGVDIVVAPAAVYEAMVVTEPSTLRKRAALLTDARWKRLMPEAYSEAQEVLSEVRRLRPGWLLQDPPKEAFLRLYRDWRRNRSGFWARVQNDPEAAATHIRTLQADQLAAARAETKSARQSQLENDYPAWSAPLAKYLADVEPDAPDCGDPASVAAWRVEALQFWSIHLARLQGQPKPDDCVEGYIDWLSAELDFEKTKTDTKSWPRFWLFDVDEAAMPRRWLRFSSGLLQQFSGWTRGTPGDNQFSTYMTDADLFVTADGGLARIAEKLHTDAPFPVAAPRLVTADEAGARQTINLLAAGCP